MNLTEKIGIAILALGLTAGGIALAKGVDTKVEEIACSNILAKYNPCKPKHCRKYCRETFGRENRIEDVRATDQGQSCECTYTPKEITVNRNCENILMKCDAKDCREQCKAYVDSREGTFLSSSTRSSGCSCTYTPK